MSCSELAKEHMCQESHFKLPHENIPQNKQNGITKKSGEKKGFIQSWKNWWGKKTYVCGPRVCTHLNTSQKPPKIQCAVNQAS